MMDVTWSVLQPRLSYIKHRRYAVNLCSSLTVASSVAVDVVLEISLWTGLDAHAVLSAALTVQE